jgi:hypothetical protein
MNCEQKNRAVLELCNLFNISCATNYHDIPESTKILFSLFSYHEVIRPLVRYHRFARNKTYQQIAIRYNITSVGAWKMCNKKSATCLQIPSQANADLR